MSGPPEVRGVSWGVARVGEEGPAVAELDRLGPRATEARRATFVAGRRAAHRALEACLGAALRVDADALGKPVVSAPGVELSITHAGGWALAAAARAPLGVDLVEREPLPDALIEDALAPGELDAWRARIADEALARSLAFAGKEAALKWLGVGMAIPLRQVRLTPGSETGTLRHPHGRAELPLRWFELRPALWAVLLGGGTLGA